MSKKEVSVGQLKEKLDQVTLIDVREVAEFEEGHIAGAQNFPLSILESQLDQFDQGQTVHVICRSGKRSARAGALLEENGIEAININGGMLAWEEI